jgi:hypothetical protein
MISISIYYYRNINFNLGVKEKIILGDSQAEAGLNDSIINGYVNLSNSGTSLLYSYIKLRELKRSNPSLKSLILGIGARSFEKEKELKWVLNEDIILARSELMPFETTEEIKEMICQVGFWKGLLNLPFRTLKRAISSRPKLELLGSFKPLYSSNLNNEISKYSLLPKYLNDTSKFELKYLRKIKYYCQNNDIEFIVVKLPNYKPYFYYKSSELDSILNKELNSCKIIDYSKCNFDSSYYTDLIHLNEKGAAKLSVDLNNLIN